MFVTETWLTESIPNEAIHISGLNVFRKDRTVTRGGGVAIYIKEETPVKIRFDLDSPLFESLWKDTIRPKWLPRKISRITVACVYLPRSMSREDVDLFYDYFQSCYDRLTAESCDTAFMVGILTQPVTVLNQGN